MKEAFAYTPTFPTTEAPLQMLGMLSPSFVEAVYPYEELTRWHRLNHIPGATGDWMDAGAAEAGGFHRIRTEGHFPIDDGLMVLRNPEYKFGEFLHHLSMDSLTSRGIPSPLIPKALVERLIDSGLPVSTVNEWVTLNVPKILGGGVCLVLSGSDVVMAFSDSIPHTLTAIGEHFAFGVLDTTFGVITENPLLVVSGAGEFLTTGITAWRTLMTPVIEHHVTLAGFMVPALGHAIGIGPIASGCSTLLSGGSPAMVADAAIASSAAATTASIAKAAKIGVVLGLPVAGLVAGLLVRRMLRSLDSPYVPLRYKRAIEEENESHVLLPMLGISPPKLLSAPVEPQSEAPLAEA